MLYDALKNSISPCLFKDSPFGLIGSMESCCTWGREMVRANNFALNQMLAVNFKIRLIEKTNQAEFSIETIHRSSIFGEETHLSDAMCLGLLFGCSVFLARLVESIFHHIDLSKIYYLLVLHL